ncbi:glycoside hydrolase, family 13 [Kipferlia bialata]|uniref:Glycoside hydrolase, family 13 n=1 Tax=Kipferlia bialata TaxID=797122 RepID=A0A9K3GM12_9EUKA|nr:glycoside hydrolase, family 13 [Kipferlia bialata]|eukprot:g9115.t1
MYTNMTVLQDATPRVGRGMALHKLCRFMTFGLAGEGYLSFMGNEFGHPEWIDFPNINNKWSYAHARRQWGLEKDHLLRYRQLGAFDRCLMRMSDVAPFMKDREYVCIRDSSRKLLAWHRGGMVWAVNLHPTEAYPSVVIGVPEPGVYHAILDTDRLEFGGAGGRISNTTQHFSSPCPDKVQGQAQTITVYLPPRTAVVFVHERDSQRAISLVEEASQELPSKQC